ncbi:uncharacterized protein OCT59_016994 [Rhizophagus irregularis]|uniref:uncharacterized protein n=1 Tax=Rhizophagus irregularis TaxID=588596 RepID=UPI0019F9BB5A|nr:hypothetical protein OCT59_016994 [Rhizophagus irregularis]GET52784.1 kinase-like domain-containing protein [Rhizophagus irregularis DAOM 181602=DAOM 197198]
MSEIMLHNKGKINNSFIIGFYGITQDPKTKDYMMILDYAEGGSLRNYLDENYSILNWDKKIGYLRDAILGLKYIHEKELFHRDLHIGCLDSDPLKRPKAKEIEDILYNWYRGNGLLQTQIKEADNINNNSPNITIPSTSLGLLTYESRLLDFNNLPEPKNSDDYYEQNDNIISKEFLESLEYCRIDIP